MNPGPRTGSTGTLDLGICHAVREQARSDASHAEVSPLVATQPILTGPGNARPLVAGWWTPTGAVDNWGIWTRAAPDQVRATSRQLRGLRGCCAVDTQVLRCDADVARRDEELAQSPIGAGRAIADTGQALTGSTACTRSTANTRSSSRRWHQAYNSPATSSMSEIVLVVTPPLEDW